MMLEEVITWLKKVEDLASSVYSSEHASFED